MVAVTKDDVKLFYAEFTDFNLDKCDDWVKENIIYKLKNWNTVNGYIDKEYIDDDSYVEIADDSISISIKLKAWLLQFANCEFWADFDVIDKPMLIDLVADWNTIEIPYEFTDDYNNDVGYFKNEKTGLPKHLPNIQYYDFYDIHTLIKDKMALEVVL